MDTHHTVQNCQPVNRVFRVQAQKWKVLPKMEGEVLVQDGKKPPFRQVENQREENDGKMMSGHPVAPLVPVKSTAVSSSHWCSPQLL